MSRGHATDMAETEARAGNLPEFTVTELAQALKRTVEDAFGIVRLRGEISGFKRATSGHVYFSLKDADAVIDAVMWRGTAGRLAFKPEDGLEVIAQGRITTYPGRSKYQIVVDAMEPAGAGALMALLEARKKKLAEEGLFDAARKRPLPYLPEVIGVVTSPTGAVLRDILHRLRERFPRHVLVWPVAVQGEKAAGEVAAAIAGFNKLTVGGKVPRPDVLIVARGGGSLEDLWAFNEEIVVRAAAASTIPLISAVGHETDTTLIDFASDRRAPTPTAAAEMAVPVRADLLAETLDYGKRLVGGVNRMLRESAVELAGLARGLGDPRRLIEERQQRLDVAGERLIAGPRRVIEVKQQLIAAEARALRSAGERFKSDMRQRVERTADRLGQYADRLKRAGGDLLTRGNERIDQLGKLLESYSFHSVLNRCFALVRDQDGAPVLAAAGVQSGDTIGIQFADGHIGAKVTEGSGAKPQPKPAAPSRRRDGGGNQGSLL